MGDLLQALRATASMNSPTSQLDACYGSVWSTLHIQTSNTSPADEPRTATGQQQTEISSAERHHLSSTHHSFDDIEGHMWNHPEYFFQVKWATGEVTHEPMTSLKEDDPHSLAAYLRKSGLATRSKTCQWANDAEYGSEEEELEEEEEEEEEQEEQEVIDLGTGECSNENSDLKYRRHCLRRGYNSCIENMDMDDDDDKLLSEEEILDKQRTRRRRMFTLSRVRRRATRKAEVALRIASKCAKYTKVIDDEGLFQMLGQLGNDRMCTFEQSSDDKLFRCPVCLEQFDSSLSDMTQKRDSNLPVHSAACCHRICCSCLAAMQIAKSNLPKWLKCPICNQSTAFNALDMPIDLFACHCMNRLESKTYVLSAAISLSSDQHRTIAGLYARSSKGSNLYRLSDLSAKKLLATKRKLRQAERSIKRRSHDLEATQKELNSTKVELAHAQDLLSGGTKCNEEDADVNRNANIKKDLLALRPFIERAKVSFQEKCKVGAENWFGKLDGLIGTSVTVIEDYEARAKVERAKKEVLVHENERLANDLAELKAQLETHPNHSKRCDAVSVLEAIADKRT